MNKKPQTAPGKAQEDLLEQIFIQGLSKTNAPAQTMTEEDASTEETRPAPQQEDSAGSAPHTNKKSRQSAVYLYLLVLFGAALLLLLLAYFVQRRSNEDAISDLRDSMTLSRQELLAEIKELEERKTELEDENASLSRQNTAYAEVNAELGEAIDRLSNDLAQLRERYEEKDEELTDLKNLLYDTQEKMYSWSSFWELERYYQAKDYESCAAILILQMQSQFRYRTPEGAEDRQSEIVRAVIDAGILDEDYKRYPDRYEHLLEAYFDRQTND